MAIHRTPLFGKTKRVINKNQKRNKERMKTRQLFKTHLLSFAAICSMVLATASCANEDMAQNGTGGNNDKNFTTFVTGEPTKTRTSMDYSDGAFYWEEGDKIYVQDDDGHWQTSNAVDAAHAHSASFTFKVPGKFNNSNTYKVYYPGKNGSNNQVSIPASQTQTEPNTTKHFGESGDCGTADATGTIGGKVFSFQLNHQASILVFQPSTNNDVLKHCYLTKIEVSSNNDITDTYTLDPTSGELTGTGSGKTIELTTKGSGTYANGFPLNTTSANIALNGAYMFIKPGTHILKVRYWVKDIVTGTEGTVTKVLGSFNYQKNTYYDMTANLKIRDYDGGQYYMWDAKDQYWKGWEWTKNLSDGQPTVNNGKGENYPKTNGDSRWYSEVYPGYCVQNDASKNPLFTALPNVNVMVWYAMKGDPRWDAEELWTTMGHLYKGGMWFLKKEEIASKNSTTTAAMANADPNGIDWRKTGKIESNTTLNSGQPSADEIGNYFYLPALGDYGDGKLTSLQSKGYFWSASGNPWDPKGAYALNFENGSVTVRYYFRSHGYRMQTFE